MTVTFGPMNLNALTIICHNLRPADAEEVLNGASSTPDELAFNTYRAAGPLSRIVWLDGHAVAAVGAAFQRQGLYAAFAYGTSDWSRVALSITKYIRRSMIPTLMDAGAHRVEAISHHGHAQAHAWLEKLGAACEGRLHQWGRDRSDFLLYAWTRQATPQG